MALKYSLIYVFSVLAVVSFYFGGVWSWSLVAFGFLFIPLVELVSQPNMNNIEKEDEQNIRNNRLYDALLYMVVPIQYGMLAYFVWSMKDYESMAWHEILGKTVSMGVLCGNYGINVAHELGHRTSKGERFLAKSLLLTSLYMHFIIEHNRGHHTRVATDEDPASARKGEWIYVFWVRSIVFSWLSAWEIEHKQLRKKGHGIFSFHNEMIRFSLIQLALIAGIAFFVGLFPALCFLGAAFTGILLLETINYIEHYGLRRKQVKENRYERVMPVHSWNSSHPLGRLMLFELSRHSDHHYLASRPYQILRHHDNSPQLPTGYPGMMLLSLFPPLFMAVMHPRLEACAAS